MSERFIAKMEILINISLEQPPIDHRPLIAGLLGRRCTKHTPDQHNGRQVRENDTKWSVDTQAHIHAESDEQRRELVS